MFDWFFKRAEKISIHAPARGATSPRSIQVFLSCNFNPRSREGSDTGTPASCHAVMQFQSTLPRGERLFQDQMILKYHYHFNPRSREGSDNYF